ncbi:MAG TPA: response regulator transcription factor [Rhizomicrobium sp.]|jgi:DNA-binding NarL/FixJ family response regulator|nr:response regulator transcription factor [Rhizomicrobium sp.]
MSVQRHNVFLVDDHPLVREWLGNLLRQQPDLSVCGEADNVTDALQGIADTNPAVAVVDLSLVDGWGLDLIKQLAYRAPETRTIVLSMHDEKLYAERMIRAGARGYVMKRETAKVIVAAIRQVLRGELYVSAPMQRLFAQRFVDKGRKSPPASPIETLSDRELEVFRLLGQGLPTRQIAHSIGLSMKTVHSYYARMREKLKLANASELVREAIRWCETESRGA